MVIIKHFFNLSSYQDGLSSQISFLLQQKRKVHKVALSLRKAMNIIKRHKIENTVTFNISSPTKEFRSTGKCFPYVVSIIYFNEFILICQKILLSMVPLIVKLPIHCLSSMFIPIESLGLGLLIRRSV